MSSESEPNIFKFDLNDISKYYNNPTTPNKNPYSPIFSPNNQLVNEKEIKLDTYNIIKIKVSPNIKQALNIKTNKKIYIKGFISVCLILLAILYFDFDDILPFEIKHDIYYEKILNEIPSKNNELIIKKDLWDIKTFLDSKMIKKFNNFIDICLKGELIDNKNYYISNNPKISVIIPLYKGGKYLNNSLRSVQNQKMKDIEIILVDDNSPDNTLLIVDKYLKEDPRIKLIKNEVNRKILYSKSIGVLNAKGKYVIQLDQDDMLIRDDLFNILYEEAENNNLDLIQFRDITKNNFHLNKKTLVNCGRRHLIPPKNNQLKSQPELKNSLYKENNIFLLWGLLIKTNIYKKAIYHLWAIIINYQIIFHEDYLILFMIIILSKNYKYLNKFAIIHLNNFYSSSKKHWNVKEYYLSVLFTSSVISDFYINDNPSDINISLNYINLFQNEFIKGKNLFPNLFETVINKILYNNYLLPEQKKFIINKFNIKPKNVVNSKIFQAIYYFQNTNLCYLNNTISNANNNHNISISIIIICKQFKYLEKTIYSVENQNFQDYEIITIYDSNEASELIKITKLVQNYKNIKLINNNAKKGYLSSIIEGVLLTQGDYILILEPGYTLSKNDTLSEFYFNIINNKEDIFEFNLLINNNFSLNINNLMLYKCHHYKSKIETIINNIKYNKNIRDIDQEKDLLFNKLIKAPFFKSIIKESKLNIINRTINNYYDDILLFSFSSVSASYKHIDNYGVIQYKPYIEELNKNMSLINKKNIMSDSIFYINYLYDNSNNNFIEKEFILNEYFNLLNMIYRKNNYSNKAYNLYKKIVNSEFISPFKKRLLHFYYHSLMR